MILNTKYNLGDLIEIDSSRLDFQGFEKITGIHTYMSEENKPYYMYSINYTEARYFREGEIAAVYEKKELLIKGE